jgi:hypothetical protein
MHRIFDLYNQQPSQLGMTGRESYFAKYRGLFTIFMTYEPIIAAMSLFLAMTSIIVLVFMFVHVFTLSHGTTTNEYMKWSSVGSYLKAIKANNKKKVDKKEHSNEYPSALLIPKWNLYATDAPPDFDPNNPSDFVSISDLADIKNIYCSGSRIKNAYKIISGAY